jgi:hypothetical protein
MSEVGRALRSAGTSAVYLVHGTFVGNDALGLFSELSRAFPAAGEALKRLSEHVVDLAVGEIGNYTAAYARLFEDGINASGEEPHIPVRLFHWSSENHHIGRADGAVRLLDELTSLELAKDARVLFWGHSHAGNVFALVTNLLGGDRESVERFFDAARPFYRWPILNIVDIPQWQRVRRWLLSEPQPLDGRSLDIVTFGTPVRYGWESAGYGRLLHFIHHRPADGCPVDRAPFPPAVDAVLSAKDGDYVQQCGIAGTNVMPSIFAWRTWWADRRLNGLLQPNLPIFDLPKRCACGKRVPEEGTTLLVDYPRDHCETIATHHAGHAVYTKTEWLLFHAEEVVRRFYRAPENG